MKRKHEDYQYDIDRLEELVHNRKDAENIFTEEDFNSAFNKELDWSDAESDKRQKLREWVWKKYENDFIAPTPPGAGRVQREGKGKKSKITRTSETSVIGRVKNRITYAWKETVTWKGKQQVRYRNNKGQFVAVKKA